MKVIDARSRTTIDQYTIQNEPVSSFFLMERAALQCCNWIIAQFSFHHPIFILAGKGNNGGDGIAIARFLTEAGYQVSLLVPVQTASFSDDAQANFNLAQKLNISFIDVKSATDIPLIPKHALCIDALFGSGLNRPITGLLANCIEALNETDAIRIAIDIPSGLRDEHGAIPSSAIFKAHFTLTFQFPFLSFFFAENEKYVGQWQLLDSGLHPLAIAQAQAKHHYFTLNEAKMLLKTRSKFAHKGSFGHVLLMAGSKGMAGASVLAARACLHAGVGKLTVHGPAINYTVLQTAVPEAMFVADNNDTHLSRCLDIDRYSVIAIGPGMGIHLDTDIVFETLIKTACVPLVIDADGITILSKNKHLLSELPHETILTPHPAEFDRLAGPSTSHHERFEKACAFALCYNIHLVLKGAYTAIITPQGNAYFNSTGNAGMATGGSGDVLTGIIAALLAQHYSPLDACRLGVFIHGLSADIAANKLSQQALIASSLIDNLGNAFLLLNEKDEKLL